MTKKISLARDCFLIQGSFSLVEIMFLNEEKFSYGGDEKIILSKVDFICLRNTSLYFLDLRTYFSNQENMSK